VFGISKKRKEHETGIDFMLDFALKTNAFLPKKGGPLFLKKFSRYIHMCPKKRPRPKKRTQLALPLY
jgi:hypothetical protein